MLEDFSLINKRQVTRNKVDWENHSVMTYDKEATHVILNVDKILKGGYKQWEELSRGIWDFLNE